MKYVLPFTFLFVCSLCWAEPYSEIAPIKETSGYNKSYAGMIVVVEEEEYDNIAPLLGKDHTKPTFDGSYIYLYVFAGHTPYKPGNELKVDKISFTDKQVLVECTITENTGARLHDNPRSAWTQIKLERNMLNLDEMRFTLKETRIRVTESINPDKKISEELEKLITPKPPEAPKDDPS